MTAFLTQGLLGVTLLLQLAVPQQAPKPSQGESPTPTAVANQSSPAMKKPLTPDVSPNERLLKVKRVYVDSFGDDLKSKQIQAMVIGALTKSGRLIVTENKEKADAILKGAGLEQTSQEVHAYSDSTAAGGAAGGHSGSVSGGWVGGTGSVSGSSSGGFASSAAGISDSSLNTETINEARVAVRLVDPDGDVIWATSQESKGAKYKGASADVADKIVKELLHDLEKLEKSDRPEGKKP